MWGGNVKTFPEERAPIAAGGTVQCTICIHFPSHDCYHHFVKLEYTAGVLPFSRTHASVTFIRRVLYRCTLLLTMGRSIPHASASSRGSVVLLKVPSYADVRTCAIPMDDVTRIKRDGARLRLSRHRRPVTSMTHPLPCFFVGYSRGILILILHPPISGGRHTLSASSRGR